MAAENYKPGDSNEHEGEQLDRASDVDELEREVGVEDDDFELAYHEDTTHQC